MIKLIQEKKEELLESKEFDENDLNISTDDINLTDMSEVSVDEITEEKSVSDSDSPDTETDTETETEVDMELDGDENFVFEDEQKEQEEKEEEKKENHWNQKQDERNSPNHQEYRQPELQKQVTHYDENACTDISQASSQTNSREFDNTSMSSWKSTISNESFSPPFQHSTPPTNTKIQRQILITPPELEIKSIEQAIREASANASSEEPNLRSSRSNLRNSSKKTKRRKKQNENKEQNVSPNTSDSDTPTMDSMNPPQMMVIEKQQVTSTLSTSGTLLEAQVKSFETANVQCNCIML
jgi:hypothetical protein